MKAWVKLVLIIAGYLAVGILLNRLICAPLVVMQKENPLNFYGPAMIFRSAIFWMIYIILGVIGFVFLKKIKKKPKSKKSQTL